MTLMNTIFPTIQKLDDLLPYVRVKFATILMAFSSSVFSSDVVYTPENPLVEKERVVGERVDDACATIVTRTFDGSKWKYHFELESVEECEAAVKKSRNPVSAMELGMQYAKWGLHNDAVRVWQSTDAKTCGTANLLGDAFYNGDGVIKNFRLAAQHYRLAGFNGCNQSSALNNLGLMYENGQGVEKDVVMAYALFLVAAQNGERVSRRNAERVERILTVHQQDRGQQLAVGLAKQ